MIRSFYIDGVTVYANDLDHAKNFLRSNSNVSEERIAKLKETDYEKVYAYIPVGELMDEDVPFIYDRRRVGRADEVVSLPLSKAFKYSTFTNKIEVPSISFWIA